MKITIETTNGTTTAHLEGRLDTPASTEVTPDFDQLQEHADGTVILDCTELATSPVRVSVFSSLCEKWPIPRVARLLSRTSMTASVRSS